MSKKVLHWCIHSDTGDHSKQNINNIKIYTFKKNKIKALLTSVASSAL